MFWGERLLRVEYLTMILRWRTAKETLFICRWFCLVRIVACIYTPFLFFYIIRKISKVFANINLLCLRVSSTFTSTTLIYLWFPHGLSPGITYHLYGHNHYPLWLRCSFWVRSSHSIPKELGDSWSLTLDWNEISYTLLIMLPIICKKPVLSPVRTMDSQISSLWLIFWKIIHDIKQLSYDL